MKNRIFCCLIVASVAFSFLAQSASFAAGGVNPQKSSNQQVKWKLRFTENFNGEKLNTKLFSRIPQGQSHWNRYMSMRDDLVVLKGGFINILGVKNNDKSADGRDLLTGGITTQGKFNIKYGKIEFRMKLEPNMGAWPAVWLMPENPPVRWPGCGEIDILERVNKDQFVYQTVHTEWTQSHKEIPPSSGKPNIKPENWNVYAFEWYPDKLVWKINDKETFSYSRLSEDEQQWPFNKPFYIMIDMQLGGDWSGPVEESTLPVSMTLDWIKFYDLYYGSRPVSEYSRPTK